MSQPIAKLPWRKGGARGGEMPPDEFLVALCAMIPRRQMRLVIMDSRDPKAPPDLHCYTGRKYGWQEIDSWIPIVELRATLPPETAKETT